MTTMLLHASDLEFKHPVTGEILKLKANIGAEFERVNQLMNW